MDLEARAEALDIRDELAGFRAQFDIDDDCVYLDGNSLGRPPRDASRRAHTIIGRDWPTDLVLAWDAWLDIGQTVGSLLAPLIGASPTEVTLSDQTSINLFKLATGALDASGRRSIVSDAGNFPSDLYVLESVARRAGGDLILAREDSPLDELGPLIDDDVGLVALSHVSYRSGMMRDGRSVTALAHDHGALMLWDLAHSAGAVHVDLDDWGADLAVGCTYKYLNGGPGAPGFLFVAERHHASLSQPITGWFGHRNQFGFEASYVPHPSIRRFLVGTPSVIATAVAGAGIELSASAGTAAIHAKAISLTSLFIEACEALTIPDAEVVTPRDPDRRGSHVTIRHPEAASISLALRDQGVIVDHRAPDLVRFGFAPLYTTHAEAVAGARAVAGVVASRAYERFTPGSSQVT